MIEISYTLAFTLYLGLTLSVVLGIWIYQHYRTKDRKVSLEESQLNICEYCHYVYLGEKIKDVTKCPQCHLYNK